MAFTVLTAGRSQSEETEPGLVPPGPVRGQVSVLQLLGSLEVPGRAKVLAG